MTDPRQIERAMRARIARLDARLTSAVLSGDPAVAAAAGPLRCSLESARGALTIHDGRFAAEAARRSSADVPPSAAAGTPTPTAQGGPHP